MATWDDFIAEREITGLKTGHYKERIL